MKRLALTFAIVLGMGVGAFAQDGGLFGKGSTRGESSYDSRETGSFISLPGSHGESTDQGAPLGGGALLLIGFGTAYALKKRKN
jgi:LPXTG-motif cell wall-anchored protein